MVEQKGSVLRSWDPKIWATPRPSSQVCPSPLLGTVSTAQPQHRVSMCPITMSRHHRKSGREATYHRSGQKSNMVKAVLVLLNHGVDEKGRNSLYSPEADRAPLLPAMLKTRAF